MRSLYAVLHELSVQAAKGAMRFFTPPAAAGSFKRKKDRFFSDESWGFQFQKIIGVVRNGGAGQISHTWRFGIDQHLRSDSQGDTRKFFCFSLYKTFHQHGEYLFAFTIDNRIDEVERTKCFLSHGALHICSSKDNSYFRKALFDHFSQQRRSQMLVKHRREANNIVMLPWNSVYALFEELRYGSSNHLRQARDPMDHSSKGQRVLFQRLPSVV